MKFKAVTNVDAPQALKDALDDLRETWEQKVLYECFDVALGKFGPAEFYVQQTDYAKGQRPFICYNLSGITMYEHRDFAKALKAMADVLSELIARHWSTVSNIQIFIVIHTSSPDGTVSRLYEETVYEIDTPEN